MATAQVALYSRQTAQEVAESLIYFSQERPSDFLSLEVVSYDPNGSGEVLHPSLFIKLDTGAGKTTLADSSEIAHCRNEEGRAVDIVLGKPAERDFQPAMILLEQ